MAQCKFTEPDDGECCQGPSLTEENVTPLMFEGQEVSIRTVEDLVGFLNKVIELAVAMGGGYGAM